MTGLNIKFCKQLRTCSSKLKVWQLHVHVHVVVVRASDELPKKVKFRGIFRDRFTEKTADLAGNSQLERASY